MASVSQAKNLMRRTIREIEDPALTAAEKVAVWQHFGAACAFCGTPIEPGSRTGHIDHLDGSSNGPRNRVLACARCNGDEKLDRPWRAFLAQKCTLPSELASRLERIEAWVSSQPERAPRASADVERARADAERLVGEFHEACTRLRDAVRAAPG